MNKLVFDDIKVSKKKFYESKTGIKLAEVNASNIVVSNKIKGNNETSKIFIGYMDDTEVIPLCICCHR